MLLLLNFILLFENIAVLPMKALSVIRIFPPYSLQLIIICHLIIEKHFSMKSNLVHIVYIPQSNFHFFFTYRISGYLSGINLFNFNTTMLNNLYIPFVSFATNS